MKYYEKVLIGAIKANYKKCVSLLLIVAFLLSIIPLTVNASNEEPQIGVNVNAADYMSVTNNDVDYTANFRNTKEINVAANTRGSFGNIKYTGNVYYYSADIFVESDSSSYGSIRMILGTCTYSAYKRYIEVCIRPNLDGQAVFFLNGSGLNSSGEYAVKVHGPTNVKVGDTYRCTVKYDNGKISFWVDGTLIFDSVALPDKTRKIAPAAGFYSQNCEGKISNVSIWGDVEKIEDIIFDETVKPVFDNEKDINYISNVLITDNVNATTYKCSDCEVKSESTSTNRPVFSNILWNNTYNLSFDAVKYDTAEKDWEGLIFKVATALKDGEEYDVEIRIRSGAAILFTRDKKNAETAYDIIGCPSPYAVTNNYTIYYRDNNKLYLWKDDTAVFKGLDLTKYGYSDIRPAISLGGEVCAFSYTNIKLWGEGITVMNEPHFNPETDTNIIPQVVISNSTSGKASRPKNYSVSSNENTTSRMVFSEITYGKSYYFSTNATMYDNKTLTESGSEYSWEGLIFSLGKAKKGSDEYTIEVRVRHGGVMIFAVKKGGEELVDSYYGIATEFGKEYKYTVAYNIDGSIEFWHNGKPVIYGYKLTEKGFSSLVPDFGSGGEVCSFDLKDMKLWGEVTVQTAPKYDSSTMEDLIPDVVVNDVFSGKLYKLTDSVLKNTTQNTGRVDFAGVKVNGDYTFFAEIEFEDNKNIISDKSEIDWEGVIFRVAKAKNNNKTYTIEVRVRHKSILVYAVDDDGKETLLLNQGLVSEYGKALPYVLEYKSGEITLWRDDIKLLDSFHPNDYGYTDIVAFMGVGCEVCNFEFSNMHLVNKFPSKDKTIPQIPESNGDYGTVTEVSENSVISFTDGVLSCSSDKSGEKVLFQYLPFKTNDTYVFGCDVTVTKAEQSWMGPRFIFGKNSKGEEIALFFTKSSLMVTEGGIQKYTLTLKRELGAKYRFDMLVEPTGLSVWVNDILLIDNVKTSPKSEAMTGVLFENTVTTIENINLYYTSPVKFVVPQKKPKPVLKALGANQYNAAEFAKVKLGDQDYNGYFDCKLISNDNTKGLRYMFKDLPIKDSQSYYYSSTFKVTQSEENWKGPRFIYRKGANATMYCAITQTAMLLLADGAVVASSPFELELGRSYDIVIYSTPDSVSVWLDGKIVFSNIDLIAYTLNDTLSAKPGILFELCKAQVTNITLYGDDIVFDPKFVDLELYNDKYFRMKGLPEKAEDTKNLFSNITMVDLSSGSLGASYDDETRTFKNDYSDVQTGKIRFLDANNSSNLNGLKNSSGYFFNFIYRISSTGSEEPDKNGTWFICNSSTAPYLTTNCDIRIGIFEDSLRLYVYKDGQLKSSSETEFNFVKDRDYRFNVVHGKNWIKLFVDDKLSAVVTDLPEYKVAFDFEICNTACNISDFELYEFEDTGLEILEKKEVLSATKAGKSVNESESYNIKADTDFPIIAVVVLGVFLIASVFGGVLIIKSRKRSK